MPFIFLDKGSIVFRHLLESGGTGYFHDLGHCEGNSLKKMKDRRSGKVFVGLVEGRQQWSGERWNRAKEEGEKEKGWQRMGW